MPDPIIEPTAPETPPPAPPETPDTPAPDPIEAAAREKGWRPQSEFTGDPALFVGAKEFLGRAPLFEKIHDLGRVVKENKKTMDTIAATFKAQVNAQVEARLAQLNEGRDAAIAEGDVARVKEFDKAIKAQENAKAEAAAPQGDPEVLAWVDANPWYRTDREMHEFAKAFNEAHLRTNPEATTGGALDATLKAVKRAFPDKFEASKPTKPPVAPVQSGSPPASASKGVSVSRLNAEQRNIHDQYVKAGIMSSEEYIKGLEATGALS